MWNVMLLSLLLYSYALQLVDAAGSASGDSCDTGQFQCSDGTCILGSQLCDGIRDCPGEEDEVLCVGTPPTDQLGSASGISDVCNPGEFQCSTGSCITENLLCDGSADCPARDDELLCLSVSPSCRLDQVMCIPENKCISLATICNGVLDCDNGFDEIGCSSPDPTSPCAGNEFACTIRGPCIPLALWCDGIGDCPNGDDESTCEEPTVSQPPLDMSVNEGDTVTLTCSADGTPPPFITWRRDLMPLGFDSRYQIISEEGVGTLTISNVQVIDTGEYHCELVSALSGASLVQSSAVVLVNSSDPFLCEDHLGEEYVEGTSYFDVMFFPTGPASTAAADIIFVVDESGSMVMEHEWLRREVNLLDRGLKEQGVGVGSRANLFALVGFGRNDINSIAGIVISPLATPDDFVTASLDLMLTGVFEDGFAAIDHALTNILPRPNTARQVILITDEDRDVLRPDLSQDIIAQRLLDSGFVLNVAVSQGFLFDSQDNESFALGLDGNGTAYYVDESSPNLFATSGDGIVNPSPLFGFESTVMDYVELSFAVGGLAWDLNQLRLQGIFAEAFTNAFTEVKVEEVMTVFRECFRCNCTPPQELCTILDDISTEDCFGIFPILTAVVTPETALVPRGETAVFECIVHSTVGGSALVYNWEYPLQSESNILLNRSILTVLNADPDSEGVYTCTATDNVAGISVSANATLELDDRCILPDGSFGVLGDIRFVLVAPADNLTRAADIILIVDESGSMVGEHAWIPDMASQLDRALVEVNVGVEPSNRFGLVGFGDDCGSQNSTLGRVLTTAANQAFTTSANVSQFTGDLTASGRSEDGYSAIRIALDNYEVRQAARQFILITDEDRDVLDEMLTRDRIQAMLETSGIILNAAISEEFSGDNFRALGIDQSMNVYIYDPSAVSLFRVIEQSGTPIPDSAYGSTNSDYTQLALELGGAAWDLSSLRQGGLVAESFTRAFVQVKVNEVRSQIEQCFNCSCTVNGPVCLLLPAANFSQCLKLPDTPLPGETPLELTVNDTFVTIQPGEQRAVVCEVNNTATIAWTFNGGSLPDDVGTTISDDGRQMFLIISEGSMEHSGTYMCLAHSQSELFNAAVSVIVQFEDPALNLMVDLSPSQPVVTTNEDITLSCTVPEPALFNWLFENGPLPFNSVVTTFEIQSLLMLTSVNSSNMGIYTCVVNNTNEGVVNEDSVHLTVAEPILEVVTDSVVNVIESATARLTCEVTCVCPGAIPQWSRPFSLLPPQAQINISSSEIVERGENIMAILIIPDIRLEDGGRYICTAIRGDMTSQTESFVAITENFKVTIEGPDTVDLQPGSSHSLTCTANQNVSNFMWTYNGLLVQEQQRDGTVFSDDISEEDLAPECILFIQLSTIRSLLVILQPQLENSGNYTCIAVSGESVVSVHVTINIGISPTFSSSELQPSIAPSLSSSLSLSTRPITSTPTPLPPLSIAVSERTLSIVEGQNVTVVCELTHPAESIEWNRFGFPELGANAFTSRLSSMQLELTITSIQTSSLYVCSARSAATGEMRSVFVDITVIEILRISLNPEGTVTVNETELLNLTCTFGCECSGASLDWETTSGTPLPSDAMVEKSDSMQSVFLVVERTTADVAGNYVCVANFMSQTINKTIEVIVDSLGTPSTTSMPTSDISTLPPDQGLLVSPATVQLQVGSNFEFTCRVTSGSAAAFEWTFSGQDLPSNTQQRTINDTVSLLSVENIQQMNAGSYICTASLNDGTNLTAFGNLIFIDSLRIAVTPSTEVVVMAGQMVVINCTLDCFCEGDIILDWTFSSASNGELPPSAVITRSDTMRTVTLQFGAASVDISGTYECVATRAGTESVTKPVMLVVQ